MAFCFLTRSCYLSSFRKATSGDFSIPVEGYLYEKGQPSGALKYFLISGNVLQLLGDVDAVGSDALAPVGTIICPLLLVHGLNVSG